VVRNVLRVIGMSAVMALSACSFGSGGAPLPPPAALGGSIPDVTRASQIRALCPPTRERGRMRCFSIVRTDIGGFAPDAYHGEDIARAFGAASPCSGGPPYCPSDLQSAYRLPSANKGNGTTVAIVDAYGYKAMPHDFATYRSTLGLKPCPIGSCFKIVNQDGKSGPLPAESSASDDWHGEQALDVDMVSAICPNCHIVLVQTDDDFNVNLAKGVVTAAKAMHANIVSTSFGGGEYATIDPTFAVKGVTFVASSGDSGAGVQQPCAFASVVCAGGTELTRAPNARGWSEKVWNTLRLQTQCGGDCGATGSGCSRLVPPPSWEAGFACKSGRAETDVSADASVRTPVAIFSGPEGGWVGIGGTSAAAPMIAGAIALAGNWATMGGPKYIWTHRAALFDVARGNNIDAGFGVTCPSGAPLYICHARKGYDGPTGWGTPNGLGSL
jgi:hypothetical protein